MISKNDEDPESRRGDPPLTGFEPGTESRDRSHLAQRRKRRIVLGLSFVVLTVILLPIVWGTIRDHGVSASIVIHTTGGIERVDSKPAPLFTLTTFGGTALSLKDLRGKVVVLNFWASWCPPCRAEAPALEETYGLLRSEKLPVEFVGIDVWDRVSDAEKFVRRFGLTFPVGVDQHSRITINYGDRGIPEDFFVDQRGQLVAHFVGPISSQQLTKMVRHILASAAG